MVFAAVVMRSQFSGFAGQELRKMIETRATRRTALIVGTISLALVLSLLPIQRRAGGTFHIRSVRHTEVRAPVAAFVKSINCDEGDCIAPGALVAQLEIPSLDSLIAQKRAQVAESEAKVRMTTLGAGRIRSLPVAEEAAIRRAEVDSERAHLQGLKEEADELEQRRQRLKVLSPAGGLVATPHLKEMAGRYLPEGELICVLDDPSEMEAEIQVPEDEVSRVQPGQPIELRARAESLVTLEAQVLRIAPAAQPATTTQPQSLVSVYCRLPTVQSTLRPGMSGHGRIYCGSAPAGIVLTERLLRLIRTEFWW
jgi:multidrug efflux pump subunit AcrA (membrane-fusion protein)